MVAPHVRDQNQGVRASKDDALRAPPNLPVLFHPDCDRRLRIRTESADPADWTGRRSRAYAIARHHRRWGLSPRPENVDRANSLSRLNYAMVGEAAQPFRDTPRSVPLALKPLA